MKSWLLNNLQHCFIDLLNRFKIFVQIVRHISSIHCIINVQFKIHSNPSKYYWSPHIIKRWTTTFRKIHAMKLMSFLRTIFCLNALCNDKSWKLPACKINISTDANLEIMLPKRVEAFLCKNIGDRWHLLTEKLTRFCNPCLWKISPLLTLFNR